MFYVGVLIGSYAWAMVAAGIVGLLILHAGYFWTMIRQRRRRSEVRYRQFLRLHVSRKQAILVLVKFPAVAGVVLTLLALGTRTNEVRSNITASTRLVIRAGIDYHSDPNCDGRLYETEDAAAIRQFADLISLKIEILPVQCKCCGEMTFDLYRGDDLHFSFSLHHRKHIRIKDSFFGADRRLTSRSRQNLNQWLEERGIQGDRM